MRVCILKEWTVKALYALDCLALLIGVAVLWRQEPTAKEFPYAMELPAMGGEDGENDLEMTASVRSALNDDDDDGGMNACTSDKVSSPPT